MTEPSRAHVSRIRSLDILRGAAIIGVITVHIMFGAGRSVDGVGGDFNIAEFAYAGLPMFMVISGYFYKRGKGYFDNVKHRVVPIIITLVISTVFLTSMMYGYLWILGYDLSGYDLSSDIMGIIIGKGCFGTIGSDGFSAGNVIAPYDISAGFYYMQILAVGLLIFYAIADRVLDDWRRGVITVLILFTVAFSYLSLVNIQLPFSAQLGPIVAAFLLIGAMLRRYNVAEYIETGYHEVRYWVIFAVLMSVAVTFIVLFPSGMTLYNSNFGAHGSWSVFTFLILSMSCGIVLWYIAAFLIRVPVVSWIFTFAGVNSLILFTQHMFVAKLLSAPFAELGTDYWITIDSLFARFTLLIGTLTVLFAVSYWIKRLTRTLTEEELDENVQPTMHY